MRHKYRQHHLSSKSCTLVPQPPGAYRLLINIGYRVTFQHMFDIRNNKTVIVAAVVLLYLAIGYYPFQLEMPVRITENGASYSKTEGLQLRKPGIAYTANAPDWLANAITTSTLGITLEIRAAITWQDGPARILTLSKDPYLRNLTIAQRGQDLIVRIRTPASDLNGTPAYKVQNVLSDADWHRIEVHIVPQLLQVSIDGTVAVSAALPRDALSSWARDYRLALGNELSRDRPWLGAIRLAKVSAGGLVIDYSQPGILQVPQDLVVIQAHHALNPFTWQAVAVNTDFVVNLLGFIPLGILLICISDGRRTILAATLACASVSLGIEIGQLFFAGRFTETTDLILNILGGALGAWIATRARSCRNPV